MFFWRAKVVALGVTPINRVLGVLLFYLLTKFFIVLIRTIATDIELATSF